MTDQKKRINNKIVTFSLPDKTINKIKEIASNKNVTYSMAIRIVIDDYKG